MKQGIFFAVIVLWEVPASVLNELPRRVQKVGFPTQGLGTGIRTNTVKQKRYKVQFKISHFSLPSKS
jgi:hypothetical protein